MKIIWMYRVLVDGKTHITTWRETYRYLQEKHDIHYIFPYAKEKVSFAKNTSFVKKKRIPGLTVLHYMWASFWALVRLSREVEPDVVILDQRAAWYSFIFKYRKHKPVVLLDFREVYYSNIDTPWLYKLIKRFTKYILKVNRTTHHGVSFISDALRVQLENDCGELHPKQLIWPSGVDVELFSPRPKTQVEDDTLKLFFHGSMTDNRGLAEAVKAVRILTDQGAKVEFNLVGGGKYKEYLVELVEELSLGKQVNFLAPDSYQNMPKYIAESDVCLMTYPINEYWEINVPLKMLEYMAMEKVVLCSEMKAFRKMAHGADSVAFIPDNTPEAIAAELKKMSENLSFIRSLGKSGREVVEDHYTWRAISEDIDTFLHEITGKEKPSKVMDVVKN